MKIHFNDKENYMRQPHILPLTFDCDIKIVCEKREDKWDEKHLIH